MKELESRRLAEQTVDPRVDLAVERTELALDRTQLAWVRTVFTLITAGLAIDAGMSALHEARVLAEANWVTSAYFTALTLTSVAALLLAWVTVGYHRRSRSLARMKNAVPPVILPATVTSLLVIVLGAVLTALLALSR